MDRSRRGADRAFIASSLPSGSRRAIRARQSCELRDDVPGAERLEGTTRAGLAAVHAHVDELPRAPRRGVEGEAAAQEIVERLAVDARVEAARRVPASTSVDELAVVPEAGDAGAVTSPRASAPGE